MNDFQRRTLSSLAKAHFKSIQSELRAECLAESAVVDDDPAEEAFLDELYEMHPENGLVN